MENKPNSGLYNVGSGKARTFKDLVNAIFKALDLPSNINFVDTPIDIRDKYQYFTEADMSKIINAGYPNSFHTLEKGVEEYVNEFLKTKNYF